MKKKEVDGRRDMCYLDTVVVIREDHALCTVLRRSTRSPLGLYSPQSHHVVSIICARGRYFDDGHASTIYTSPS